MAFLVQIGLDWVGSQIVAGVVGAIVGLFIREILPESIKTDITFWGGRVRKWLVNRNYRIRLSADYRFDSPVDYEEIKENIAREVGERPRDVGQFSYTDSSGSSLIEVELDPQYSGSVDIDGTIDVDTGRIESIIASFETSPRYRDLVPTLLDLQSVERVVNEVMTSEGARSGESIIHCEMPAKPILRKILGAGDIETLRAKSGDGTRIDISSDEIQVHSPPTKAILPTIRKAIVFYT